VSDVARAVGQRIAAARRKRGWTQAELAERLGWPRDTLVHYEHGRRALAVDRLVTIADALGVPPAALLIADQPSADLVTRILTDTELRDQITFFIATLDDTT
jgi:transcriptional regulator with XRE-family HTH domain